MITFEHNYPVVFVCSSLLVLVSLRCFYIRDMSVLCACFLSEETHTGTHKKKKSASFQTISATHRVCSRLRAVHSLSVYKVCYFSSTMRTITYLSVSDISTCCRWCRWYCLFLHYSAYIIIYYKHYSSNGDVILNSILVLLSIFPLL